ncbi:transcription factor bHLH69-like [Cynara cardunculus var. scolymus]|uniref:transcription factor bHLH69-like n=1 Tax=Cynara cardunculus var. scolymus TaxID=59895 RepID=UPI000D62FA32|nr:transcription factor bHLH69-like [Cynara cardunculus var. scolymus]
MAPYYVEYLAGNAISDIQGELLYNNTGIGCSFTPVESFHSMDAHQKQGPDEGLDNAAQNQPNMSASTSGILTKSRKTYLRQKASDTDRRRRTRIAAALDALEDLLPESKEGNKTNIVDDCIDYIKCLQLHLKELSQNRLGGEPTSNHLAYLEGYGHYLVHENTASGPLQDMMAKLLDGNPSAATKLLESRGLFMMPNAPN